MYFSFILKSFIIPSPFRSSFSIYGSSFSPRVSSSLSTNNRLVIHPLEDCCDLYTHRRTHTNTHTLETLFVFLSFYNLTHYLLERIDQISLIKIQINRILDFIPLHQTKRANRELRWRWHQQVTVDSSKQISREADLYGGSGECGDLRKCETLWGNINWMCGNCGKCLLIYRTLYLGVGVCGCVFVQLLAFILPVMLLWQRANPLGSDIRLFPWSGNKTNVLKGTRDKTSMSLVIQESPRQKYS